MPSVVHFSAYRIYYGGVCVCELVRQTCVPLLLHARIPDLLSLLIGLCGFRSSEAGVF